MVPLYAIVPAPPLTSKSLPLKFLIRLVLSNVIVAFEPLI